MNFPPRRSHASGSRLAYTPLSPSKTHVNGIKRPRSPDIGTTRLFEPFKRVKTSSQPLRPLPGKHGLAQNSTSATTPPPLLSRATSLSQVLGRKKATEKTTTSRPDPVKRSQKESKRREKEEQEEEFRRKYTAAFPKWTFYFEEHHLTGVDIKQLKDAVSHLGARWDDGLYNKAGFTHFISNYSEGEGLNPNAEKENGSLLSDPLMFQQPLTNLARVYGHKIWNASKLQNILERCRALELPAVAPKPPRVRPQVTAPAKSLKDMLALERVHGPSDRDPKQRHHDWRYCGKDSFWLLVEDLREEIQPVIFQDYGPFKDVKSDEAKPPWPKLFCHPNARHPFQPFDAKEQKRYEKLKKQKKLIEKDNKEDAARFVRATKKRREQEQVQAMGGLDLRRTASVNSLCRQFKEEEGDIDLDADVDGDESATASGFLASGAYAAASGNSVSITSTAGTTTSAGMRRRFTDIPAIMRSKTEFVTNRKATPRPGGTMGPPNFIPDKANAQLRKSKSLSTVRLPKRDEGKKPGYCESCRQKFDDFDEHTQSKRHQAFAHNNDNFMQLDLVLNRVARRSCADVAREDHQRRLARSRGETRMPQPVLTTRPSDLSSGSSPLRFPLSEPNDDDFGAYLLEP